MSAGRVVFGAVLIVVGLVWILQGIGVLPGSFMTGDVFWAVAGMIAIILGGLIVIVGVRRPPLGR